MADQTITVKEAIKIAIKEEIKAYNLYMSTSKKVTGSGTKTMLLELAEQELGHQKLLENTLPGGLVDKIINALPLPQLRIQALTDLHGLVRPGGVDLERGLAIHPVVGPAKTGPLRTDYTDMVGGE